MAFAAITGGASAQSKTADQTGLVVTPDQTYAAGTLLILFVATDDDVNDGTTPHVGSITDTQGLANTWARVAGISFNSAQGGVAVSMWWSKLAAALTISDTVTAQLSNNTSRDATAAWLKGFTVGAGMGVAVEASATGSTGNGDPGSISLTTANIECLRIRGIGGETSSTTVLTPTTSFTVTPGNQTTGGGGATNMAVRGEFRIVTGTTGASDPTWVASDNASVYAAFKEVSPRLNLQGRVHPRQAVVRSFRY